MLGVAGTQILADVRIAVGPEAFQVVRDLLRSHVGRQKVQHDADASAGDPRRFAESEDLLNPDGQNGGPTLFVDEADAAAAGDCDSLGGFALDGFTLRIREPAL